MDFDRWLTIAWVFGKPEIFRRAATDLVWHADAEGRFKTTFVGVTREVVLKDEIPHLAMLGSSGY